MSAEPLTAKCERGKTDLTADIGTTESGALRVMNFQTTFLFRTFIPISCVADENCRVRSTFEFLPFDEPPFYVKYSDCFVPHVNNFLNICVE